MRLRNDAAATLTIRIGLDDRPVCAADIPSGTSRRLDCVINGSALGPGAHAVVFEGGPGPYTIENLELATHFGALTPGPRHLIIAPAGFSGFRGPPVAHAILIFLLLVASVVSLSDPPRARLVRVLHLGVAAVAGAMLAIAVLSSVASKYSVLVGDTFLERFLVLIALPALWRSAPVVAAWMRRPTIAPIARPVAVGLLGGSLFLLVAVHLTTDRYGGHASGLVMISHYFFDKDPMVAGREDIRQSVLFSDGHGYDGQFLYFMAYDPLLTEYRTDPHRYSDFIDFPPYRYGRIGFSVLTKIVSANQPTWYPVTMVALVIASLGVCGALLAAIAQRHGLSVWYGLLVVVVPGFWQSLKSALPEPVAIALILGAYWCLTRQKWIVAGALLGMSMLVRETGGVFVLAALAGLLMARKWRDAAVVALLAFAPIVIWKAFVGWVFWPEFGMTGLMPHPDDVGWPFAGVWELWTTIAHGQYFTGLPEFSRAAVLLSVLTMAAFGLAVVAVIKRPGPMAAAALLYALLTITFNYQAVWTHVGNADRLTIDLFVALAIVTLESARDRGRLPAPWAVFWSATACYVFFGAYEAGVLRGSLWVGL
jgi:hypothetical protein